MKLFITSLSLLLFSFTATAQQNEVHEYLTMMKVRYDLHISIGSSGYEKVDIKGESDDSHFDLSAINSRISTFETEGWEFLSADHTLYRTELSYRVVMRRPKN